MVVKWKYKSLRRLVSCPLPPPLFLPFFLFPFSSFHKVKQCNYVFLQNRATVLYIPPPPHFSLSINLSLSHNPSCSLSSFFLPLLPALSQSQNHLEKIGWIIFFFCLGEYLFCATRNCQRCAIMLLSIFRWDHI